MSQNVVQLTSSAEMIAEEFSSSEDCDQQRKEKIKHSQPGKQNIEESHSEVCDFPYPKMIIPVLLFHFTSVSLISMMHAGQIFAHFPHPMHFSGDTAAKHPL